MISILDRFTRKQFLEGDWDKYYANFNIKLIRFGYHGQYPENKKQNKNQTLRKTKTFCKNVQ